MAYLILRSVLLLLLVDCFLGVPVNRQKRDQSTCGYSNCPVPKDGMLNIHLIPHSHDDVGWLKTVDQYYYGERSDIQRAGVQYILDSVTSELLANPERRFVQVETAFFWQWWLEQDDEMRENYKSLINSGQIEMTGGAWTMNDEAAVHYQSTIDQFTLGLRRLNDTFGECGRPRIGWQIDTFGHSRETASLLAQIGFDGLFFARLSEEDRNKRLGDKTAEMIWRASANLGAAAELFTSAFFIHYSAPTGYCFDILCGDIPPIIDNPESPDYNVESRFNAFRDFVTTQGRLYATENILVPMGDDFNYQDAHIYYKNMDKLIKIVNAQQSNGSNLNAFYSSPACYLKAVNDANLLWTTKDDDFFPYATDSHTYWTGFYSSRPALKRFERLGNNLLQVCKQLSLLADVSEEADEKKINQLREAMGVIQHHDAITGTENQDVANDYARILAAGITSCDEVANAAISKLLVGNNEETISVDSSSCLLLNISQCEISEQSSSFLVTVYNPLSHPVSHYVRLPVSGSGYDVTDTAGNTIVSQLVPVPESVINIPERTSQATNDLVFQAQNIPGFGFLSYQVKESENPKQMKLSEVSDENSIGNENLTVELDPDTGLLKSVSNNGVEVMIEQNFHYYMSGDGDNAYIFRPNGTEAVQISGTASINIYKGDLVEEVHQVFSDWASQVIRVYKGEDHVEFEWMVGSIPSDDGIGKQPISRFTTDLDTQGYFYTDSNGRELIQRKRNYRPTWDISLEEPVSGNYYPVTSKILLRDENKGIEVAVLNDRAQGGSSLADGHMELMVHRRLLINDFISLNETQFDHGLIARGHHYLLAGNIAGTDNLTLAAQERLLAQHVLLKPWIFLSATEVDVNSIQGTFTGVSASLPQNIQVLTLERLDEVSILLRLEHILEKNDDPVLSAEVTVNLQDILSTVKVVSFKETTLAANQWLVDSERLSWKSTDGTQTNPTIHEDDDDFNVTLSPMQIRTFIIYIE